MAGSGQFFLAQKGTPWTLGAGAVLYAAALFLFASPKPGDRPGAAGVAPRHEVLGVAALGLLAVFFRLYQWDRIPPGMTTEVVCGPYLGYALPPAQWPLYYSGGLGLTHPDIPLWGWAWFHLFEPSHLTYSLFYAFLSLLAFPLGYLLFRDLAGARAAMLALFFWGIMEWHFTLSRNGHPVTSLPLYLLGAVLFLRSAWQSSRTAAWVLAGLFGGAAYFAYPAARAVLPLTVVLFLFEIHSRRGRKPFPARGIVLFGLVALGTAALGVRMVGPSENWLTGATESHMFIGWKVLEQRSLAPLWDNLSQVALVFNRTGPANSMEGLPGRRLLDDVTGPLFILGFFLALARWREARYFYPLAGVLVLCLPALLSDHPYHTRRMIGMAPFIAYLAALAVLELWRRAPGKARPWVLAAGLAAGIFAAGENFKVYFVGRAQDAVCWGEADADATAVGQAVADGGDAYDYYLSPAFFQRFQVLFLGHREAGHMHSLELADCVRFLPPPPGRGLLFALQQGRTGVLALLQGRYPGGTTQRLEDPWGHPYLYLFRVSAADCSSRHFEPLPPGRYWQGTYWNSLDPGARPVLKERDPVLNFSDRNDFPVKNAQDLRVEWKGTLHPRQAGAYGFLMSATGNIQAELSIDGRKIAVANQEAEVVLEARDHAVRVLFLKEGGFTSAFHLAWRKPGDGHYGIVPPDVMK